MPLLELFPDKQTIEGNLNANNFAWKHAGDFDKVSGICVKTSENQEMCKNLDEPARAAEERQTDTAINSCWIAFALGRQSARTRCSEDLALCRESGMKPEKRAV
jgi:hypothetical protein